MASNFDNEKKKVSDVVSNFIVETGVKHVFLISGGGNMHLIDSVGKQKGLEYICTHHEQAAAMAAEGYARINENLGVCLVTTGPGGTNTLTGLIGAWLDSIPVLFISGQVNRDNMITGTHLRQLGIQEINIVDMVKPVSKYAITVSDPHEILYHLQKAVFYARTGRPGPVWVDIPTDVQGSLINPKELKHFDPAAENLLPLPNNDLSMQVAQTIEKIKAAKRPIILAGHGIHLAKAKQDFITLLQALKIPVLTTMSAVDLLESDHALFVGRPGSFGDRAGNFAVQNSDLLISLGARMHLWNVGYKYADFARNAKKIVVDIDPEELKKKTIATNLDLAIEADVGEFIREAKKQLAGKVLSSPTLWLERCLNWKNKYPVTLPEYKAEKDYVNSYYFIDELSNQMKPNEVILTSDGTSFTCTYQAIKIKPGQRHICNVGCAAMGYEPAAIGVCFANQKQRTILITGDGSMMMNLQELQTLVHHNLPIKIFLLNNQGYLAIRITQGNYFNNFLVGSSKDSGVSLPDFKKIALAFGLTYESIRTNAEVPEKIAKVLENEGPVLCEIFMSPSQPLVPKPFAQINPDGTFENRPLEDMYPFLDRQEFASNMNNN